MEELFVSIVQQLKTIFWGNSSLISLLEIIFRTSFMYIYTLFLVRIIGKRGVATLAPFEMAVIVVLGSVLADPMLNVKTPLIKGMVIMSVIVAMERLLVHLTEKNTKAESFLESSPRQLVSNGVINLDNIHKEGFSRDDLFLNLREKGIEHLGEIKCSFLETNGRVSVWIKGKSDITPGLSVFPCPDSVSQDNFQAGMLPQKSTYYSCQKCGYTQHLSRNEVFKQCQTCNHDFWEESSLVRVEFSSVEDDQKSE
ncbi:MAG: YetF domain-containing protein [Bacteriovoracaceae bacterium]